MTEMPPGNVSMEEQALRWQEALSNGTRATEAMFARWLLRSPENVRAFLKQATLSRVLRHLDSSHIDLGTLLVRVRAHNDTRRKKAEKVCVIPGSMAASEHASLTRQLQKYFSIWSRQYSGSTRDDLVQEVLLRCLQRRERCPDHLNVAKQLVQEFEQRTRNESRINSILVASEQAKHDGNIWADALDRQLDAGRALNEILRRLPLRNRAALILRIRDGSSLVKIAATLNCSIHAAKKSLAEAQTMARACLVELSQKPTTAPCGAYQRGTGGRSDPWTDLLECDGVREESPSPGAGGVNSIESRASMAKAHSAVVRDSDLRDRVKTLIEMIPGCTNVRTGLQLGTQTIDLYYEERTSFGQMRIVCECMSYRRSLTKEWFAQQLYPRYFPLLQRKLVDAVRIITSHDPDVLVRAYAQQCGFSFHTLDQLESQIIDFRGYLHSLLQGFVDEGLTSYYIRPVLESGEDLEDKVISWVDGSSNRPLAILAGYGMGKTSFACRLTKVLGEQTLRDPGRRIPILIPLAEISTEQSLEGLLGKILAGQHRVPGYNFALFHELNRRGRFVVILDGFDEMKHAMSWPEFKYNLSQLQRLMVASARVLLLGRPTAFLSEEEERHILSGGRRGANQPLTITSALECDELSMWESSTVRAIEYVRRHALHRSRRYATFRKAGSREVNIEERIQSIQENAEIVTLARRPVQAKILADLVIDSEVQWRSFNRYDLYREFISRISAREALKTTRRKITQETRLRFLRRVAWWVWCQSSSLEFNSMELPQAVYGDTPGGDIDPEALRRDLVSGSILEKKAAGTYCFPHRSFVEFLVAEFICTDAYGSVELTEISARLTSEVSDFIRESGRAQAIVRWGKDLNEGENPISMEFLALIAWAENRLDTNRFRQLSRRQTPYDVILEYRRLIDRGAPPTRVVDLLRANFNRVTDESSRLMCIVGLLIAQQTVPSKLREQIEKLVVTLVLTECLDELQKTQNSAGAHDSMLPVRKTFRRLLSALQLQTPIAEPDLAIHVNWPKLLAALETALPVKWRLLGLVLRDDGFNVLFRFADLMALEERLTPRKRLLEGFFHHAATAGATIQTSPHTPVLRLVTLSAAGE